jgi:hypothetical protein
MTQFTPILPQARKPIPSAAHRRLQSGPKQLPVAGLMVMAAVAGRASASSFISFILQESRASSCLRPLCAASMRLF